MISKKVRQMMAASMAVVMTVGLAGCGNGGKANDPTPTPATSGNSGTETKPTEAPQAVDSYTVLKDANGNKYDLGGIEVVIRDWWSSGTVAEPNNAFEEAQQEYREWIQTTYNFTIKEQAISDWGSTPQDFVDYVATGGNEYYLFCLRPGGELVQALNSGLMYNLSTLDCLNFKESKWPANGVDKWITIGNDVYGMRAGIPEPRGCVYFNKRLLQEAGVNPDDLYKWQANKEWTWDKFEEICSKVQRDTNSDGTPDIYAMVQQGSEFHTNAVYANGGSFVDKDASGKYYNDLASAETIEALNWSVRMRATYEMPQPEGSNWDYFVAEFMNGSAAFFTDQGYRASTLKSNMTDEFGCVVFPMGPSSGGKYIGFYSDNVYAIPACYDADKAWKIAFAYNLYTEPVPGFEDETTGWKASYYGNFWDTESVDETMQILTEDGVLQHVSMIAGISLGSDLLWGLGYADSETGEVYTPAQKAEQLKDAWNSYIDTANSRIKQ